MRVVARTVTARSSPMGVSWWHSFPTSPPLDVEAERRYKRVESRLTDVVFLGACDLAGIEPTRRQARKWNNGKGLALRHKNQARKLL